MALGECDTEGVGDVAFTADEAGGDDEEVTRKLLLRALDEHHLTVLKLYLRRDDVLDAAVLLRLDGLDRRLVDARVMPENADGLLLAVIDLQDLRPLRPRIRGCTLDRWLRHHLDLGHRLRALADRGTAAVVSGVTTTDDDDVLPLRVDDAEGMLALLVEGLRLARQVVDRVVDAVRLLDGRHVQSARLLRATGEDDRVVVAEDRCRGDRAALSGVRSGTACRRRLLSGFDTCLPARCCGQCLAPYVHTGPEDDAFRFHEGAATADDGLV